MKIDQHTLLYGVLGNPVRHSLGPSLHNAAFSAAGLNAVYLAFETGDIEGSVRGIKALGIRGASVTIPFKSGVIPFLDEIDPLAGRIGAVNTILNEGGLLKGYNTDALGGLKALGKKTRVPGMKCVIIGAGGAARALGFALKERGAAVLIANRSDERGKDLARLLGCSFVPLDRIDGEGADILVQATPVGMFPHMDRCPVPEQALKPGMVVMDLIYNPAETRLLKLARARGCATVSGINMFVHQAAEQFRLWTGTAPPVEVMARAVMEALEEDEEH